MFIEPIHDTLDNVITQLYVDQYEKKPCTVKIYTPSFFGPEIDLRTVTSDELYKFMRAAENALELNRFVVVSYVYAFTGKFIICTA